ncbi:TPA: transcriptional regulator [Staphylococcus aureus]|nr:transcriptional regulator [Staphylococcus aureus]
MLEEKYLNDDWWYELGKYVTEQVYIMMTANDDVEAPSDYVFRAEVSE